MHLPLASNVAIDCSKSTVKATLFPSSPLCEPRPALAIQKHLAATERLGLDAFSSILVRHEFRASESEFLSIRAARLRMDGDPQVHPERANLERQTFSECERD